MDNVANQAGHIAAPSAPMNDLLHSIKCLPAAEVEQLKNVLNSTSFQGEDLHGVRHEGQHGVRHEVQHGVRTTDRFTTSSAVRTLSARETDVLTLIASGYTRREIGNALCVSSNTAASHIASIYRKLGIGSIAEATHVAIRHGVVKLM